MSAPTTADLSAHSPSDVLSGPGDAPLPQIGLGSRGKPSGGRQGLLNAIGSKRAPRPPGSPSSLDARDRGRGALQAVRREPEAAKPTPPPDRPRTAAGAPAATPRRIPKTRRTEQYRDAMTRVLGKDQKPGYYFMPAESQEVVNRIMRHTGRVSMKNYDLAGRQALQDDFDMMRGKRPRSKVAEAVGRARDAYDAPAEDRGPVVEHGPRQRSPEREEAHRIALEKLRKSKEALDEQSSDG